jgi:hypothetical protein
MYLVLCLNMLLWLFDGLGTIQKKSRVIEQVGVFIHQTIVHMAVTSICSEGDVIR